MHKDVAAKWTSALRSGDYKQTEGRLQAGGAFCCLGVLCDIYSKETGKGWWTPLEATGDRSLRFIMDDRTDSSFTVLPDPVRDWAGLKENEPRLPSPYPVGKEGRKEKALTALNDSREWGFESIADLIDRHASEL